MDNSSSSTHDLSELILAMDVVDTIRHEQSLVDRELRSDEDEAGLIEKLAGIYRSQGIEVTPEVLAQGVRALREERFAYRPPKPGFQISLARLYVRRGTWAKWIFIPMVLFLLAWGGWRFLVVMPQEKNQARIQQEVGVAAADIRKLARETTVRERAQFLEAQAEAALRNNELKAAGKIRDDLHSLQSILSQEYTLRVVSRPGTPSGVWRHPEDNRNARNYYLVVEAVAPDGKALSLPITSEENGRVSVVQQWGLRVPAEVFEKVRRDKEADGIVDDPVVGRKQPGFVTPEYRINTTGKAITEW
jgi:hypothetical protein